MNWYASYLVKSALQRFGQYDVPQAPQTSPYHFQASIGSDSAPGDPNALYSPLPSTHASGMVGGATGQMQQQEQNRLDPTDLMFNRTRGVQNAARGVGQAGRAAGQAGRVAGQAGSQIGRTAGQLGRVAGQAGRTAGQTASWGGRLANMVGRGGVGGWGAAIAGGAAAAYALPNLMWNLSGPGIGMRARNERVQAAGGKAIHTQGLMDSGSYDFSSPMQKLIPGS
jgi:hypothetical protein